MRQIFTWAGRILFLLGILGLIACGVWLARFSDERADALAALTRPSTVIETSVGEVEVITEGDENGRPVLVLHGTPGGYDQALAIGRWAGVEGARVIAPSRPGYLRTPLESGIFFSEQADAMAALLDAMELDTVDVIGQGAGAAVAAELAGRHPDRVSRLVLIAPPTAAPALTSPGGFEDAAHFSGQIIPYVSGDFAALALRSGVKDNPDRVAREVLALDTTTDESEIAKYSLAEDQRGIFEALVESWTPISPREIGMRNDYLHIRIPTPVDFSKITAPALVIVGDADAGAASGDPKPIQDALPEVRVIRVPGAGSLVWLGDAAAAREAMREFLDTLVPERAAGEAESDAGRDMRLDLQSGSGFQLDPGQSFEFTPAVESNEP